MVHRDFDYKERINAFTKKDWHPLLKLIPEIENTSSFGKVTGGGIDEEGAFALPHMESYKIVDEFIQAVYSIPVVVSFNWSEWEEGRKMVSDENFDFDTVDIPTKCKIITAIVRNDRFSEGALVSAFESGLILKLLKSIQKQLG